MKKKSLVLGLSILASISLSVGLFITNTNNLTVNAELERETDMVVDGFSVRVNVSEDDTTGEGVRFHIGMTTDLYNSLTNEDGTFKEGITTGTIIIPTALKSGDLSLDTPKKIDKDTTNKWFAVEDDQGNVTGMQSIVYLWDIPSTNYGNDISVVGYINNKGTITYSAEEARSMSWVAKEEYNDPDTKFDDAMKAQLKEKYIDKKVTLTNNGEVTTKFVAYDEVLTVEEQTKAGYTFDGWFNKAGTAEWNMSNKVTNPINLHAQWTRNAGYEILVDPNSTEDSDYEVRNQNSGSASALTPQIVDGTATIGTTEKVIKINVANGTASVADPVNNGGGNFIFHCKNLTKERLEKFDYVTVNGYAEVSRSGLAFYAASEWSLVTDSKLADQTAAFSYSIPAQYLTDDTFRFVFSDWTGTNENRLQNLYITSIVGGYNAVEAETEVKLLEKTRLTAVELANTRFESASETKTLTADELVSFTPMEKGKIVLNLNVKGYAKTELEIQVETPAPMYNDFLRIGDSDTSNYKVSYREYTDQLSNVTQTIVDGSDIGGNDKVLFVDTSSMGNANMRFHVLNIETEQLNDFDYYTIVGYFNNPNKYEVRVSAAQSETKEVDDVGDARLKNINGEFTYTVDKQYFVGNHLQFCFSEHTTNRVNGMYIFSITGGYNDVAVNTEVKLTEKGYTAAELEGTRFISASGTRTLTSDELVSFTPEEAGTIELVITKAGYKQTTVTINVTATTEA